LHFPPNLGGQIRRRLYLPRDPSAGFLTCRQWSWRKNCLWPGNSEITLCGEATTGQEAVDLVLGLLPDLVELDLSMPGMNGFQASKTMRRLLPAMKIIILSSHDSLLAERQALKVGADAYQTKTADPAELFKMIWVFGTELGEAKRPDTAKTRFSQSFSIENIATAN
jgi:CheY-like chemotaxis protein